MHGLALKNRELLFLLLALVAAGPLSLSATLHKDLYACPREPALLVDWHESPDQMRDHLGCYPDTFDDFVQAILFSQRAFGKLRCSALSMSLIILLRIIPQISVSRCSGPPAALSTRYGADSVAASALSPCWSS